MKRTNFLITTIMSTLLLSSTISAQPIACKGGKCFIDLSKLSQPKNINLKSKITKPLDKLQISAQLEETPNDNTIVLDHSKYIMSNYEKENHLLTPILVQNTNEELIVFSHSKYVMTEQEKKEYFLKQRLEEAELEAKVTETDISTDSEMSDGIILPHSELYCDNEKQAKFHPESNEYECT
jgi:hypothetical protein